MSAGGFKPLSSANRTTSTMRKTRGSNPNVREHQRVSNAWPSPSFGWVFQCGKRRARTSTNQIRHTVFQTAPARLSGSLSIAAHPGFEPGTARTKIECIYQFVLVGNSIRTTHPEWWFGQSGWRASNPLPSDWKSDARPNELHPRDPCRVRTDVLLAENQAS